MGRLYHMGTCVRNMVRGEAENFNAGDVWEFGDSFCKLLLLYLLVFFLRKLCCLEGTINRSLILPYPLDPSGSAWSTMEYGRAYPARAISTTAS